MTIVGLNQAVLVTILQHLYVLPPVTFLREFRLAYEMYHTRILFFERYVCRPTLTYSILEYTRILEPCYKLRRNAHFFFGGGGKDAFFLRRWPGSLLHTPISATTAPRLAHQ